VVCEEWWEDVVVVRYLASYLVWLRILGDEDSYLQNYHFSRASVRMWKIPRDCRGESESL
jgi:hypothetical protein